MWNYARQLLTSQWKNKRNRIKKRDGGRCTKCGSKKHLEVHHIKYIWGKKAWEYADNMLTTMCKECHRKEHK